MVNYTSFPTNITVRLKFLYDKPMDAKQDKWGNLKYPYGVTNIGARREEYLYATEKLHEILQKLGVSKGIIADITKKEDGQYKYFEVVVDGEVLTTQGTPKIEGTSGTKETVPEMPPEPPPPWDEVEKEGKKQDLKALPEIDKTIELLSTVYARINEDEILCDLEQENKRAMAISVYINLDKKGLA